MTCQGTVVAMVGDGDRAVVRIHGASPCRACEHGYGCGLGLLSAGGGAELIVNCQTVGRHHAGDKVIVKIEAPSNARWLLPVFGAYGLPLIGLLLMLIASSLLMTIVDTLQNLPPGKQDLLTGLAAATGLAGGVFIWRKVAAMLFLRAGIGYCSGSARIVRTSLVDGPLETSPIAD